jgi:hypothetical protein
LTWDAWAEKERSRPLSIAAPSGQLSESTTPASRFRGE